MASKGTRVTPKEVERMVKLFNQCHSYTKVAKKMRRSPSTVSKYVSERLIAEQVGYYYNDLLKRKE